MIWTWIGLLLAVALAAAAWRRSLGSGGFYDRDVYAMRPATHRRYAIAGLAFAVYFAAALVFGQGTAGIAGLALYALVAVIYATSFLRGASDLDE
jgi:hypothetical protein